MTDRFDHFVVLAEMRTGPNFLETNLNALDDVVCHGEAFNPHFIAYPNRTEVLGITQDRRDKAPNVLLSAIRDQPGVLAGFRFFHDHDLRVLDNPRCAKIILTRNPLDSYVSWKIAQATGQWKLTNLKRRKEARARFDKTEFLTHVQTLQAFQLRLLNSLQRTGQTAFYIGYEDLQSLDVMNGLALWLGVTSRLDGLDKDMKRQNPQPVLEKVVNPDAVSEALDRLDLTRTPNFEPRRGPAIPTYVAAAKTGLLYLPIRSGPESSIAQWLADLDNLSVEDLQIQMNQKKLRLWKRGHVTHRSFTVLSHPVARAHRAFCRKILSTGPGSYPQIRETLHKRFKVPMPKEGPPDDSYTIDTHRVAFEAYLEFVRSNLAGQTGIRVDAHWNTQAQVLSGFADFGPPDFVLREDELEEMLPLIARQVGHEAPPLPQATEADTPYPLDAIYGAKLEALVAEVYQRDYMMFGFGAWKAS